MLITNNTHKPETADWFGMMKFWREVNENQINNENTVKKKGE